MDARFHLYFLETVNNDAALLHRFQSPKAGRIGDVGMLFPFALDGQGHTSRLFDDQIDFRAVGGAPIVHN